MNRRDFLHSLFASSAAIVVAPAVALEALDAFVPSTRTYFDMGRSNRSLLLHGDEVQLSQPEDGTVVVHVAEGSLFVDPSNGATFRWEPIQFTEDERLRTHAAKGWRLIGLKRIG